ncbi:hypothetical protein [Salisaeta longa]|uniref:hypothetical protein n=1 Tax=Salisaeta longa TaxID=503170 RepID=UPI0003B7039F|nr:hypothetical protein [Salisaeta longa]
MREWIRNQWNDWVGRNAPADASPEAADKETPAPAAGDDSGPATAEDPAPLTHRSRRAPNELLGYTYTLRTKDEPNPERPFAHGFVDGLEQVERAPFERLVTLSEEEQRLTGALNALRERRATLETYRDTHRSKREAIARATDELAYVTDDLEAAEARAAALQEKVEATAPHDPAPEAREHAPRRGSIAYALLYSIAGLVFIAGDVIMSREVVSRALRLQGEVEPWIFAVGLAMLAVLMKPAYDRLVEKPYWEGRTTVFRRVIVGGALAAAVTLGVLGGFRAFAFETNQTIRRLQSEQQSVVQQGNVEAATAIGQQVSQLQESIAGSWWGFLSFVLSGVLFAAAGAVCLGIGLHHGRDWYHRSLRPLWMQRKQKKAHRQHQEKLQTAKAARDALKDKMRHLTTEITGAQAALEALPPLDEVQASLKDLRREAERLRAARALARSNAGIDAYRNGYALANGMFETSSPDDTATEHVTSSRIAGDGSATDPPLAPNDPAAPEPADGDDDDAAADNKPAAMDQNRTTNKRRPFLALRDAIANHRP